MELGSILQFLENKSIIVTGATGFLAKSIYLSFFSLSLFTFSVSLQYFTDELRYFDAFSFSGKSFGGST